MTTTRYQTPGGIGVQRTIEEIPVASAIEPVIHALDERRGVLLASSYEYPGRYTRWDMGFVDPPRGPERARPELPYRGVERARPSAPAAPIAEALGSLEAVESLAAGDAVLEGAVRAPYGRFAEEERSRQPSLFSVLRALVALFHHAGRAPPRPLRRLRLRPRLSVRTDPAPPRRARPTSATFCCTCPTS